MRPLIVFSGQGIARADGFNLTRRLVASGVGGVARSELVRGERHNLDAIVQACASDGAVAFDELLRGLRSLCLKERRSTLRKIAHRDVFELLAEQATQRLVVHLTSCVDSLTTTFAVRDFGARWAPFGRVATLRHLIEDIREVVAAEHGMLHVPIHGEAALVVSSSDGLALQTYYGEPSDLPGHAPWRSSLGDTLVGPVAEMAERFPITRIGCDLLGALLTGAPLFLEGQRIAPAQASADLVVIGYGARPGGFRTQQPFEASIARLVSRASPPAESRWVALLYRPPRSKDSSRWLARHGFSTVGYDDREMALVLRRVLATDRSAACVA